MKLNIPYYSQLHDVADTSWQRRSCGIVSLAMVLEYAGARDVHIDRLIKEGLEIDAYLDGVGWKHDGLVALAKRHGVLAHRKEFRARTIGPLRGILPDILVEYFFVKRGIKEIRKNFRHDMPVIVSVAGHFKDGGKPHLVVLTGAKMKHNTVAGFYYHEPHPQEGADPKNLFVDIDAFKKHWRKMAIFVSK